MHPARRCAGGGDAQRIRICRPTSSTVSGLGHVYLKGTPLAHRALEGADLRVHENEVYGLAGATGSGKSTLLQHLNGLILPQEGRVTVGPHHLDEPSADRFAARKLAGLAFQNPEVQLFETFVGDEIAFGPRQAGLSREEVRASVRWAMEQVGLGFEEYKDRRSFALSGGERKKVALASILARRPEILLLDEPLAGLDPRSRDELLAGLRRLAGLGLTILVSSHQMDDLAGLVERRHGDGPRARCLQRAGGRGLFARRGPGIRRAGSPGGRPRRARAAPQRLAAAGRAGNPRSHW